MRHAFLASFAVLLLVLSSGDAFAAKKKSVDEWELPMVFSHVRASGPCEPSCPEWIAADGKITPGTSKRFLAFLKTIGNRPLPLIIQSAGGDVSSALAFGRFVRERKMTVAVGRTEYEGCAPRANCKPSPKTGGMYRGTVKSRFAYCNSACPIVFVGGVQRLLAPDATIGVHQVTTTWQNTKIVYRERYEVVNGKKRIISRKEISRKALKPKVTTGMHKELRGKLADYYRDMGIDTEFINEAERTPANKITSVPEAILVRLNVVTSNDPVSTLTAAGVCGVRASGLNCVTRKPGS